MAQSNSYAIAPYSTKSALHEALRLPIGAATPTVVLLEAVEPGAIEAVKRANTPGAARPLQIGIGRAPPAHTETGSAALRWTPVADGAVAHWQVTSPDAKALRVGLAAARIPASAQVRFVGSAAPATVYGPFSAGDIASARGLYWSPVLEGDTATIEIHVAPGQAPSGLSLSVAQVSHLFASPAMARGNMEIEAQAAQFCHVDVVCRSVVDAELTLVARSVAKMVFSDPLGGGNSFVCTGTLLNPKSGPLTPYVYSASHCLATQSAASTLVTYWLYDRTGCGTGSVNPASVQLAGGATLLYADKDNDVLLLRLNGAPPGGAVYSGWDVSDMTIGMPMTAIHHPDGDVKKLSLGTMDSFPPVPGPTSNSFFTVTWNATATGVAGSESGGSGIFSYFSSPAPEYRFRGALRDSAASCTAPAANLYSHYHRLALAAPHLLQYLDPGAAGGDCADFIIPRRAVFRSDATSGAFTVEAPTYCTWTAVSDAPWLTSTSRGPRRSSGTYSMAPNTGSTARTATITIGGLPLTVVQAAASTFTTGPNLLANPGFEAGAASWTETPSGSIIRGDAATAHSGKLYAWLGGYDGANDGVYQEVAIPASASRARIEFWYQVGVTERPDSTSATDTMSVSLIDPTTGTVVAELAAFSNLNSTRAAWIQSPAYDIDVSAYRGRRLGLRFKAITDGAKYTSFFVDDVSLSVDSAAAGTPNYTAMWWNPAESGWGFNVNHQGDTIFATLFTYDASKNPMWLVMSNGARQAGGTTFTGDLYRTSGPAFNAAPFTPIGASNVTQVGAMTIAFNGTNAATLTYSVNGVNVTKAIQKQVFGTRAAECVGTEASRASATNYTDMWWNAAESGWGVNLTQQGDTIFATLFTYASSGQGLWLVMSNAARQADGSYLGDLFQTTGQAFNAQPFFPISASNVTKVGTMRLRFTSGTAATLSYSVNGVSVAKSITRQVFSAPLPLCTS